MDVNTNPTLAEALSLQTTSYSVLRQLEQSNSGALHALHHDHSDNSIPQRAQRWIDLHGSKIDCFRSIAIKDQPVVAHLLASYMASSFDPGSMKWVHNADKKRAKDAEASVLQAMAATSKQVLSKAQLKVLMADTVLLDSLAIATWVALLYQRIQGAPVGTEALVLWRRFAWTLGGVSKPDFTINEAMVTTAQATVHKAVSEILAGQLPSQWYDADSIAQVVASRNTHARRHPRLGFARCPPDAYSREFLDQAQAQANIASTAMLQTIAASLSHPDLAASQLDELLRDEALREPIDMATLVFLYAKLKRGEHPGKDMVTIEHRLSGVFDGRQRLHAEVIGKACAELRQAVATLMHR
jgi:hypothetical protein